MGEIFIHDILEQSRVIETSKFSSIKWKPRVADGSTTNFYHHSVNSVSWHTAHCTLLRLKKYIYRYLDIFSRRCNYCTVFISFWKSPELSPGSGLRAGKPRRALRRGGQLVWHGARSIGASAIVLPAPPSLPEAYRNRDWFRPALDCFGRGPSRRQRTAVRSGAARIDHTHRDM